jgi:hypothetical protein
MTTEKIMTERSKEMAGTGAVEEDGGTAANTAASNSDNDDIGAAPPTSLAERNSCA